MHRSVHCVVPPYIVERLARSRDPRVRRWARANLAAGEVIRDTREAAAGRPRAPEPAPKRVEKERLVYDAGGRFNLPGALVRSEGDPPTCDPAVDEAYDHAGVTYDFFREVFERRSLDGEGVPIQSTVHVGNADGEPLSNAFWNGEQMAYGDGDGRVFGRFTAALDVVGHELTHGVQTYTNRLVYRGESGSLNEHFADVFGVLARQWRDGVPVERAGWLVGEEVVVPAPTRRAIRDMERPGTAFTDDPDLGSDPQPGHMKRLYRGPSDRGGVHINSGIPNRAFVLAAQALGGKAWEVAGRIWYAAMQRLEGRAGFAECARETAAAAERFDARVVHVVRDAWGEVGIPVAGVRVGVLIPGWGSAA